MKIASKLATTFAILGLAVAPALAQGGGTTALDNIPGPGESFSSANPDMTMSEGLYNIFFDAEAGAARTDEDAMAMFQEASPEDQEMAMQFCTMAQEEEAAFLDSVESKCLGFGNL